MNVEGLVEPFQARLRSFAFGPIPKIAMRSFVERRLVASGFACHGTLALARYYEGLWRRNVGKLNEASWDFDAALDFVQARYEEERRKYQGVDDARLRRS